MPDHRGVEGLELQQRRLIALLHVALQRQRRIQRAFGDLDLQQRRIDVVLRAEVDQLPVDAHHEPIQRVTEPRGVGRDRIENGLNVGRRLADDAQDVARRRLLLQRLRHLRVTSPTLKRSRVCRSCSCSTSTLRRCKSRIAESRNRFM